MLEKVLIFKIEGKSVEIVDWDCTIDEIELLKREVALIHSVKVEDIEIDVIEVFKPETSKTTFATAEGLMFKAPNDYSMLRPVKGLVFMPEFGLRRSAVVDIILDKINDGRVDDIIIYS